MKKAQRAGEPAITQLTLNAALRHPEKAGKAPSAPLRKPPWLRVRAPDSPAFHAMRRLVHRSGLNTVCQEAACPNIGECWAERHATVMILGDVCTRGCAFCNVATGRPRPVDAGEPARLAAMVAKLGLSHVVVTSVDRDDLPDGGAGHFAACIRQLRRAAPDAAIEVLTPDFLHKPGAMECLVAARPDVFNHNLETVPRLYRQVRPGARYFASLNLLWQVKRAAPAIFTKSGLMVGLGEGREEVLQVMDDLRAAGVDALTVGQYLQPTPRHHEVARFWTPEEFRELERLAYARGFAVVAASPLTRSSHRAGQGFAALKRHRAG